MTKVKTYVGTDGKLHFVNSAGADTALNFNSGGKTYLYKNGDECTGITGGWDKTFSYSGYSIYQGTKQSKSLLLPTFSGNESVYRGYYIGTNNIINLSGYSRINVKCKLTQSGNNPQKIINIGISPDNALGEGQQYAVNLNPMPYVTYDDEIIFSLGLSKNQSYQSGYIIIYDVLYYKVNSLGLEIYEVWLD